MTRIRVGARAARRAAVPLPLTPASRNQVLRSNAVMSSLTAGTTATHLTDFGQATLSLVADPVSGTSLTQALDVTIPANASRTYSPVLVAHSVPMRAGELWTMSFYARKVAGGTYTQFFGTLANNLFGNNMLGGTTMAVVGGWTDTTWHRFSTSFTAAADATLSGGLTSGLNVFYLQPNEPVANAVQYRVTGLQLEPGGVATPFS